MWKGAIAVGLMSITVRLYAATEDRGVQFRQVHRDDGGKISIRRRCDVCGDDVAYADIAKAYEFVDGRLVVVDDDDLASLPLPTLRTIEVLQFVQAEEIDSILYDRTYYVEPDGVAATPYALLLNALRGSGRVAIAKIALRHVERLAVIRVRGDLLVAQTMRWPDEIRTPLLDPAATVHAVQPTELAMTRSLIDSMTGRFEPDRLQDTRRAALLELVSAKAERDTADATPVADAAAHDAAPSRTDEHGAQAS
ncbi:Ku protein [Micromonospora sp. KLBMP9576]|uniref:non-homologous end joining protein Ku n=1 Tax=Micromonospora sp. KLBMP9576 TaxID=3424769 RepID=UPI003D901E9B